MHYPLSADETTAMARYLSEISDQLQHVVDLFRARYGTDSTIAELAVKTLACSTSLKHELMIVQRGPEPARRLDSVKLTSSAIY